MKLWTVVLCGLAVGCGDGGGDGDDGGTGDCDESDEIMVFTDADGDGYGAGESFAACAVGDGQAEVGGDCDDQAPRVHPGAAEVCNGGIDDDCDGPADDHDDASGGSEFYEDNDGDGFGAGGVVEACEQGAGLVVDHTDCDDTDDAVHPGALEVCDGFDNDCDSSTSEEGTIAVGDTTYTSIQAAINAASAGDVVHICDGTFDANLSVTKDIVLEGVGASVAIIDGNESGPVIAVDAPGVDLTIRGLTLRNGVADNVSDADEEAGGGIQAWSAGKLVVEDSIIERNEAEIGGGIFGPESGNVVLRDTVVTRNSATIDAGGGAFLQSSPDWAIEIDGCEFTDNRAELYGGGIAFDNYTGDLGAASITDTGIDGNSVMSEEGFGGGILSLAELSLTNVTVSNNEAMFGGGVYVLGADSEADAATDFTDNNADVGGGLFVDQCEWRYGNIEANTARIGGGALVVLGSLRDVTVQGNEAEDDGGGVGLFNDGVLEDSDVTDNVTTGLGGGLVVYGDDPTAFVTVDGCAITGNTADYAAGGAYTDLEFESIDTNWGTGSSDNDPDDLLFYSDNGDFVIYDDFGSSEDFVCDFTWDDCG